MESCVLLAARVVSTCVCICECMCVCCHWSSAWECGLYMHGGVCTAYELCGDARTHTQACTSACTHTRTHTHVHMHTRVDLRQGCQRAGCPSSLKAVKCYGFHGDSGPAWRLGGLPRLPLSAIVPLAPLARFSLPITPAPSWGPSLFWGRRSGNLNFPRGCALPLYPQHDVPSLPGSSLCCPLC